MNAPQRGIIAAISRQLTRNAMPSHKHLESGLLALEQAVALGFAFEDVDEVLSD